MLTKRLACKPGPAPHQANTGSAGRDLCLRMAPGNSLSLAAVPSELLILEAALLHDQIASHNLSPSQQITFLWGDSDP